MESLLLIHFFYLSRPFMKIVLEYSKFRFFRTSVDATPSNLPNMGSRLPTAMAFVPYSCMDLYWFVFKLDLI